MTAAPSQPERAGTASVLRVTLYSDALYYGGAERYLVALAHNFSRGTGGEVALSAIVESAEGADRLAGELEATGARVVRSPRPGFDWWKKLPDLLGLFRETPGDVLHVNLPSSYDAGVSSVAWAAKQAGYRAVVTTEHLPMVERKYKKFPIKFFFSHWVDRAIAIADSNRSLLIHRHGVDADRVVALPNGIDAPPRLSPAQIAGFREDWGAGDRAVVGCVGRLTARKGQHDLLAAVARLPREARPLLVLVGEGEEDAALRAQSTSLGLDTVFTGPRADAASLPQAFDLFVLASSVETMPLTVLEAMAGGTPVLATDIYGLPELVEEGVTGRLVPSGNVPALSRVLGEMLGSPEALHTMGEEGRRQYETRFTSALMSERTLGIYHSALAGAGVRTTPATETAA